LDRRKFFGGLIAAAWGARTLSAGELEAAKTNGDQVDALMTLLQKTAGGKQFWADVWFFRDWRIQRNSLTGHYRLLDGSNRRHLSGTYEECRDRMDQIRKRDNLQRMQGKAVIILHGLFRTRSCMSSISGAISKAGGYTTFCMGYPTTRGSLETHARSLDSVVRSLEGISEINFIGHSLGNLVVRHWLKDFISADRSLPKGQGFGRMVMLAPPNHQPQLATTLVRGSLARLVAGPSAEALAGGWESLEERLGIPHFDFGVLAGGKQDGRGFNPLLPGDDDGVVTVESTRLAGARDFRILPVLHSFFMNDRRVHEYTIRFLQQGHFESDESRQPIAADQSSAFRG
jgi:pimeloyl-ACP methyl ester carboxylesterase